MGGVHIAPFPHAFRYGWDEETAVAFALKELDHLLQSISTPSDTAGFIIEPVLGDGGYIPTPPAFLQGLRERADRHGIVFIVDEVQAGVGRTGKFWGHDWAGIRPDIVITAKGLASGFPISAIAASTELMSKAWPGSQGGTYGGNAVAAAAGVATLGVIERENLVSNAQIRGEELRAGLEQPQDRIRRNRERPGPWPDAGRRIHHCGQCTRRRDGTRRSTGRRRRRTPAPHLRSVRQRHPHHSGAQCHQRRNPKRPNQVHAGAEDSHRLDVPRCDTRPPITKASHEPFF